MTIRHCEVQTDLGSFTIVAQGSELVGLYFKHHIRRPAEDTFGEEVAPSSEALLGEAASQLLQYLAGERTAFDLPLSARGDSFQTAVWGIVEKIPYGETATYGSIARQLGDLSLAQKVGQAVGANPLCIFVPCHRVVGANGALTGYAGGLKRKQSLLELEEPAAAQAKRLF